MKLLNIRITGTRPTADERDTARRVVHGDAAAMKALYDQSAGKLTATCARYVTDEDDLHDVLQEAYIKIFTRGKDLLVPLDDEADKWLPCDEPPAVEDVPLDVLQDMIRRLPSGQRTVFNLYVFEGKSHKEIAALLQIGESSSASQFSRAKSQLAQWIQNYRTRNIS